MNFIQQTTRYDHQGKARHYQRTFEYCDQQGAIQWNCDVFGSCISAPTVFAPQAHGRESFTMTAKGKFMNATYYLDDANGRRFATITRKGVGFRWKILGADDNEIFLFRIQIKTTHRELSTRQPHLTAACGRTG